MEENTDMPLLLIYNALIETESIVTKKVLWDRDNHGQKGRVLRRHAGVSTPLVL